MMIIIYTLGVLYPVIYIYFMSIITMLMKIGDRRG